jgi:hypothetical protein
MLEEMKKPELYVYSAMDNPLGYVNRKEVALMMAQEAGTSRVEARDGRVSFLT